MSLVTTAEVRGFVEESARLGDVDLQGLIDREESYLAHRVGPLVGPRDETIRWPTVDRPIRLRRPTDAVVVTEGGVTVDGSGLVLLGDGQFVDLVDRYWRGPVVVTYTPTDELDVKRVVLELIRLSLTETPYDGEAIGDYSYSQGSDRGGGGLQSRGALWRSLLPKPGLSSVAVG